MSKFKVEAVAQKNIPLLFAEKVKLCPETFLQAEKDKSGKFQYYSYKDVYEKVLSLCCALKSIGVTRNQHIALISDNRKEWLWTDLAILSLGCCDVPRGCDSMGNEIRFICSFADCQFGFFENARQVEKLTEKIEEVTTLKTVIVFDKPSDTSSLENLPFQVIFFEDLLQKGKSIYSENPEENKNQIQNEMSLTEEDSLATMIFTSGTTGTPKGVMLTHKNYISQLGCIHSFIPGKRGQWWLTVLPVWHVFERFIQYVAIFLEEGLAYSKPIGQIMLSDMAVIKPNWMCGVPRLWEQVARGIKKLMNKKGGITLKLFNFFVKAGTIYVHSKEKVLGLIVQYEKRCRFLDFLQGILPLIFTAPIKGLGHLLVFSKIQKKFGGNLKIAISGGGSLQKETEDFYHAVGLNLLEGYGLSETAPVISFRYYKTPRPGCVGAIFPTWEVKIVKEEHGTIISDEPLPPGKQGLILCRGSQLMKGYYKRPDLTEKAIDKDGWFNTGDLGMLSYNNEIKITGRAKDTIVLLGGENIEPLVVESALLASDFIESSMLLGQDKKYIAALIVPSKDNVEEFAQNNKIDYSDYKELITNPKITELFQSEITRLISAENGFRTCEKIFKFALIPDSFKVGDELSAKQEMIRYRIAEKYSAVIENLFIDE
ncbi:MAG: long-chain fatty acid--CoA ligase [Spirochaetia bacterium]|nr:long-chain fatty acid--CoA ligase [Spirochaetia bacterium]